MMILNFILRLLEIVMLVALAVESVLALILMVAAFGVGLWPISVLIAGFLAAQWWLVLSSIMEGK